MVFNYYPSSSMSQVVHANTIHSEIERSWALCISALNFSRVKCEKRKI